MPSKPDVNLLPPADLYQLTPAAMETLRELGQVYSERAIVKRAWIAGRFNSADTTQRVIDQLERTGFLREPTPLKTGRKGRPPLAYRFTPFPHTDLEDVFTTDWSKSLFPPLLRRLSRPPDHILTWKDSPFAALEYRFPEVPEWLRFHLKDWWFDHPDRYDSLEAWEGDLPVYRNRIYEALRTAAIEASKLSVIEGGTHVFVVGSSFYLNPQLGESGGSWSLGPSDPWPPGQTTK